MNLLVATLLVFLLAAAGLALGLMFGRSALRGSCGGLSVIPGVKRLCSCDEPCPRRKRAVERTAWHGRETGQ